MTLINYSLHKFQFLSHREHGLASITQTNQLMFLETNKTC